jgi:hypothetical protein
MGQHNESPNIPADLLNRSLRRPNGGLGWRPADAPAAVAALAAAGYAVLGGEWWTVLPDGTIWPAVPRAGSGPVGVYGWSLPQPWDQAGESWDAFCERAAVYTLDVRRGEVKDSKPLPVLEAVVRRTHPDLWPGIHYTITFTDRDRYLTPCTRISCRRCLQQAAGAHPGDGRRAEWLGRMS